MPTPNLGDHFFMMHRRTASVFATAFDVAATEPGCAVGCLDAAGLEASLGEEREREIAHEPQGGLAPVRRGPAGGAGAGAGVGRALRREPAAARAGLEVRACRPRAAGASGPSALEVRVPHAPREGDPAPVEEQPAGARRPLPHLRTRVRVPAAQHVSSSGKSTLDGS